MSSNEATLYEIRNGAAWITLNRPENRNALSAILVTELYDHLTQGTDRRRSLGHCLWQQIPGLLLGQPAGDRRRVGATGLD